MSIHIDAWYQTVDSGRCTRLIVKIPGAPYANNND